MLEGLPTDELNEHERFMIVSKLACCLDDRFEECLLFGKQFNVIEHFFALGRDWTSHSCFRAS